MENDMSCDGSLLNVKSQAFTYEDVLVKLGTAGRYQMTQAMLCLSGMVLSTYMSLGFVFIGYSPPHWCSKVNETELLSSYGLMNDSSAMVSYGKCDVIVKNNKSGHFSEVISLACPDGRHFSKGKYMTFVSEWDLVCEKTGQPELVQLLFTLGVIIGGLTFPNLADRYGRKPVICISGFINMVMEFSIAFAPNIYYVCTALFIDGISYSGLTSAYLVLGVEMLIPKHRQMFGFAACQYWVFCSLTVGFLGYLFEDIGWRYLQATGALTGLPLICVPFFLFESPRWLATKGRRSEALAILKKASKQNGTKFDEVEEVFAAYMNTEFLGEQKVQLIKRNNDIEDEEIDTNPVPAKKINIIKTRSPTLLDALTNKDNLKILLIIWYLWTTCNLTYFGIFMSSSNLSGNRFLNFCLLSLVEIPANIILLIMLNKMGRLVVFRVFLCLASIGLFSSVLLAHFEDSFSSLVTVSTILFIFAKFAVTAAFNAVYIFTPEIFPTVLRSAGVGSCKSIPKLGYMLAPYSRPLYVLAKWAPGLVFSSICFIAFLLTFFLPETKDKVLPTKITDMNKNNDKHFNRSDTDES